MLKRMKQQIKQETEQERIHMKDRTIRGVIFDQDGLLFDTERGMSWVFICMNLFYVPFGELMPRMRPDGSGRFLEKHLISGN